MKTSTIKREIDACEQLIADAKRREALQQELGMDTTSVVKQIDSLYRLMYAYRTVLIEQTEQSKMVELIAQLEKGAHNLREDSLDALADNNHDEANLYLYQARGIEKALGKDVGELAYHEATFKHTMKLLASVK